MHSSQQQVKGPDYEMAAICRSGIATGLGAALVRGVTAIAAAAIRQTAAAALRLHPTTPGPAGPLPVTAPPCSWPA